MPSAKAYAPINIALIKYWGKRDVKRVLPYNESISLTLDGFGSTTMLETTDKNTLEVFINDHPATTADHKRVQRFLSQFEGFDASLGIRMTSVNTVPIAAGFASSASAYAALAKAANRFFKTDYDLKTLSEITRKGSGSATRSLLGGAVAWDTQGNINAIAWPFDDTVILAVSVNEAQKEIPSREAMAHCVKTSSSYTQWVSEASNDAEAMKAAIDAHDFKQVGIITERNALLMHETMANAKPPIEYLTEESKHILSIVSTLQREGIEVYATMDAGPNVKLLCKIKDIDIIQNRLIQEGFKRIKRLDIAKKGAHTLE